MHILACDCLCVCYNMLPVVRILSVTEGSIIHELLCGRLVVQSSQGIH